MTKSIFVLLLLLFSLKILSQPKYFPNDTLNRYDIHYMKPDLEVMDTSVFIKGSVTIKATVVQDTKTIMFDFLNNMIVDSVYMDNVKKDFTHSNNHIRINYNKSLNTGKNFEARIWYHGYPVSGIYYRGKQTGFPTISNVSESYLLWCWLPCKQILTDKIDSIDVWLTTRKNLKAYSNGMLRDSVFLPQNKIQYQWQSRYPIAYYLITIGAGNYAQFFDEATLGSANNTKLPLTFYLYNNKKFINSQKNSMAKTKQFVHLLDSLFGTYPFDKEKYGVALAQIFDNQGMENQTMSVNQDLEPWLNIHELQHQWFGDMVTCKSFHDIWLHEGFATYSELLGIEFLPEISPGTMTDYVATWHKSVVRKPGGSVYVPDKDLYNETRIFDDRLTYDKGGSLVHMLRFETGNDSLFFAALRNYLNTYKYGNADVTDLINSLKAATGIDFTTFFNQWYYGEGYPAYTVTYTQNGKIIHIKSAQSVSMPSITPFFKMKMEYKIQTTKGDTIIVHYQDSAVENFDIKINGTVTGIIADPNDWVIDGTDKQKDPAPIKIPLKEEQPAVNNFPGRKSVIAVEAEE